MDTELQIGQSESTRLNFRAWISATGTLFYWARALIIILRTCHLEEVKWRDETMWYHMNPKFKLHLIPESFQEPIKQYFAYSSKDQIFVSLTNSLVNVPTSPRWTLRWRCLPMLRSALEPEQAWVCRQNSPTDGKGGGKWDRTEIQPKQWFSACLHIIIVTCWPLRIYSAPPLQDSNLTDLGWSPHLKMILV